MTDAESYFLVALSLRSRAKEYGRLSKRAKMIILAERFEKLASDAERKWSVKRCAHAETVGVYELSKSEDSPRVTYARDEEFKHTASLSAKLQPDINVCF